MRGRIFTTRSLSRMITTTSIPWAWGTGTGSRKRASGIKASGPSSSERRTKALVLSAIDAFSVSFSLGSVSSLVARHVTRCFPSHLAIVPVHLLVVGSI